MIAQVVQSLLTCDKQVPFYVLSQMVCKMKEISCTQLAEADDNQGNHCLHILAGKPSSLLVLRNLTDLLLLSGRCDVPYPGELFQLFSSVSEEFVQNRQAGVGARRKPMVMLTNNDGD